MYVAKNVIRQKIHKRQRHLARCKKMCAIHIEETEIIDHLHYDVIHAKPDGSCSRPAETGPSVS